MVLSIVKNNKKQISTKFAIALFASLSLIGNNSTAQNIKKNTKRINNSLTKQINRHKTPKEAVQATNINLQTDRNSNMANEEKQQIATVLVTANRGSQYFIPKSSIFQFNKAINEIPQNITQIPAQLIADQNSLSIKDALKNVSTISIAAGEGTSQGDNLTIRGFSARNDYFLDGIRDFGSYNRDPFNVENIEVVQGPSSIAFGRGSAGGIIEQNSKKPLLDDYTKIYASIGTNNTMRSGVDSNYQFGKSNAIRINAISHHSSVARRNIVENNRYGLAPTISFNIGGDTQANISHLIQAENNIPDYGIPFTAERPADVSPKNFYGYQDDYFKSMVNISSLKLEHQSTEDFKIRNQTRFARYNRDIQATYPTIIANSPLQIKRAVVAVTGYEIMLANQTDLQKKLTLLGKENEITSGVIFSRETSNPTRYDYSGLANDSLIAPSNPQNISGTKITRFSVKSKLDSASIYLIDDIKINKEFSFIGGVRFDQLKSDTDRTDINQQTKANYRGLNYNGSIVYRPVDNQSYYFNYATSFNPSAESIILIDSNKNDLSQSKAEENKIFEVGNKTSWLENKLHTTISLFRINKNNGRERDNSNIYQNIGSQRVDGLQMQINGNITNNWQITSGYSLLDSSLTNSAYEEREGNKLSNIAKQNFTLFTIYQMPKQSLLSQFSFGGGVNAISARFASTSFETTTQKQAKVSGYATANLLAKYQLDKNITMQLNINNLFNTKFNEQVYSGYVVPGEGLNAIFSGSLRF